MGGACGTFGGIREMQKCMQDFGEKPGEKSPLGRHMLRWDHNIQTDDKETKWEGFDQFNLAQNRYIQGIGCCEHGKEHYVAIKC